MREHFAPDLSGRAVACPYCGSNESELFSLFGQQLLTVQYYCNVCHTPFEYVRDDDRTGKQGTAPDTDQVSSEEAQ